MRLFLRASAYCILASILAWAIATVVVSCSGGLPQPEPAPLSSCEGQMLAIVRGPGTCADHQAALAQLIGRDPGCVAIFGDAGTWALKCDAGAHGVLHYPSDAGAPRG